MRLSRALKEKNRLIGKIKEIQNMIAFHNSYIKGNKPIYDIENLWELLNGTVSELTELKTRIQKANTVIRPKIYKLSELKSLAAFLKGLQIKEGKLLGDNWRNSEVTEWQSEIGNLERDRKVEAIEKKIDTLQNELDQFNFETEI
ncbi:MAG: hypothetical protein AAGJ12_11080 [Bacteroidota bacterium]